jgi:IS30 family transposase
MRYERTTFEEREEIFRLRYEERLPQRETGERPGKDKSSVSRKLKRGTKNRLYNPVTGEANRLNAGRRQRPKLKMFCEIWDMVKPKPEPRRPPEQAAQWLEKKYPCYRMSAKTIYNHIHFHMKGELKKAALEDLRQKGKKRRKNAAQECGAEIRKRAKPGVKPAKRPS